MEAVLISEIVRRLGDLDPRGFLGAESFGARSGGERETKVAEREGIAYQRLGRAAEQSAFEELIDFPTHPHLSLKRGGIRGRFVG